MMPKSATKFVGIVGTMVVILSLAAVTGGAQVDFGILTTGVQVHGSLHPETAFPLDDQTLVDIYLYEAHAGERVTVVARSNAFQPYVFITDLTGMFLAGDTHPGSTESAVTFTFPETDYYGVAVNTAAPGQTGAYTVILSSPAESGSALAAPGGGFGIQGSGAGGGVPAQPGGTIGETPAGQSGGMAGPGPVVPSNWPVHGALPPNEPVFDRVGGPDDSFRTYTLDVPPEATRVVFELRSDVDLDMFVRHGAPMDHWGTDPDFQAMGDTGYEEVTISAESHPPLATGTYFVDVANLYPSSGGTFTLTAHMDIATGGVGGKGAPSKGVPTKGTPEKPGGISSGTTDSNFSGGLWEHPSEYFQIRLPTGFDQWPGQGGDMVTMFGSEDGNQLLIVFKVPNPGLSLDVVANHVPELLQMVGPFQMSPAGFQSDAAAGEGVWAADAHAPAGAFARTYVKSSADIVFIISAITPSPADFQNRAPDYEAAVASVQSAYRLIDPTGGQRQLLGSWERATTGSGAGGDFSGGRTTWTFYSDGTMERHSVSVVSLPGYGSSQSSKRTSGVYAVLGDTLYAFWNTDQGVSADMAGLQVTANELYLDNAYYRRVD